MGGGEGGTGLEQKIKSQRCMLFLHVNDFARVSQRAVLSCMKLHEII